MNVEFENIETLFTFQLKAILEKTEGEIAEVKARIHEMRDELEMLNREMNEDEVETVDLAARFIALASIIKYQVKEELENRKFELN